MRVLSPGARNVLRAISALIDREGISPTVKEICKELGFTSTNGVSEHIDRLLARGLVTHRPKSPRTLRVTEAGRAEANMVDAPKKVPGTSLDLENLAGKELDRFAVKLGVKRAAKRLDSLGYPVEDEPDESVRARARRALQGAAQ